MEEATECAIEPPVRSSELPYGVVIELGAAEVTLHAFEQAHEVRAVRSFRRRSVCVAAADRERTCHGEVAIHTAHVQDRLRLEVEDRWILAQVRDLDHAAAASAVVDQERLVALATQFDGDAVDPEDVGRDRRYFGGKETRRRSLEDAQ